MSRARKTWSDYSPAYRARLTRHGITEANYRDVSRTKARGHGRTPERPAQARKHPEKYPEYVQKRRRPPQGGPALTLAERVIRRKEELFGDFVKFNQKRSARAVHRNPTTHQPPSQKRMQKFLAMNASEVMRNVNWRNDDWAFLFYH